MKHNFYLPTNDTGKVIWFENFYTKLLVYAAILGITPAQLADLEKDKKMFAAVVVALQTIKDYLKSLATFKREIANGTAAGAKDMPVPTMDTPPTAVTEGIFNRVTSLIKVIKVNANYTETIGNDLGIIGTEINHDFDNAKPAPKLSLRNSSVYVKWKKEQTDAVDIDADYGDGSGFAHIARVTTNHFVDPHLPATGESKIYRYKLRFVVDDEQVGLWSDDEEITVTGI